MVIKRTARDFYLSKYNSFATAPTRFANICEKDVLHLAEDFIAK